MFVYFFERLRFIFERLHSNDHYSNNLTHLLNDQYLVLKCKKYFLTTNLLKNIEDPIDHAHSLSTMPIVDKLFKIFMVIFTSRTL